MQNKHTDLVPEQPVEELAKVLFSLTDGIAHITLNRPGCLNALDGNMVRELAVAIERACDDSTTRVIMIAGAGKAFCVGGDINTFGHEVDNLPGPLESLLVQLNTALLRMASSGLPIISLVNGAVGGGGIGLALCADYVLAAQSMVLRCGYSAIGLTPDAGSAWFLTQRVGTVRAKQLFYLNDMLDARGCHELGIVDAVHPDPELAAAANTLAKRLSAGPKSVFARTKSLIEATGTRSLSEHLNAEREYIVASAGEPDAREGIRAFLEKRTACFSRPG